ncbi:MAG TPA: hypothetical protein VIJ26_00200 [Thermoanaerobaculia bacterium]
MRSDAREPVFQLFACCLPVKGARRSLLCDVQRQAFQFIPNGLYEILTEPLTPAEQRRIAGAITTTTAVTIFETANPNPDFQRDGDNE